MPKLFFTSALRREIITLVVIKILLLGFIKVAFFSAPPASGTEEQAQHLLGFIVPSSVSSIRSGCCLAPSAWQC